MSGNLRKKILRHAYVIKFGALFIKYYLKLVYFTSKVELEVNDRTADFLRSDNACLITIWHGKILVIPEVGSHFGVFKVLASRHRDGKYIDEFISLYGHQSIRGSSFTGKILALRKIIKQIKDKQKIVITPDGPRGPRYKVNSIVTKLALQFKIPIIHISYAASRVKILRTWDRFNIPLPFCKLIVRISEPVYFRQQQDRKLEQLMLKQMQEVERDCLK